MATLLNTCNSKSGTRLSSNWTLVAPKIWEIENEKAARTPFVCSSQGRFALSASWLWSSGSALGLSRSLWDSSEVSILKFHILQCERVSVRESQKSENELVENKTSSVQVNRPSGWSSVECQSTADVPRPCTRPENCLRKNWVPFLQSLSRPICENSWSNTGEVLYTPVQPCICWWVSKIWSGTRQRNQRSRIGPRQATNLFAKSDTSKGIFFFLRYSRAGQLSCCKPDFFSALYWA